MIFVMGIDQWRTETDWPLPDTQYRPYYFCTATEKPTVSAEMEP
jgi:uncharacterized protein